MGTGNNFKILFKWNWVVNIITDIIKLIIISKNVNGDIFNNHYGDSTTFQKKASSSKSVMDYGKRSRKNHEGFEKRKGVLSVGMHDLGEKSK